MIQILEWGSVILVAGTLNGAFYMWGHWQGKKRGYETSRNAWEELHNIFGCAKTEESYQEGRADEFCKGYDRADVYENGHQPGYSCGYEDGWSDGHLAGYETGRQDEFDDPEPRGGDNV